MIIYKGAKYSAPMKVSKVEAEALARTKWDQTKGRTIDRLEYINNIFTGVVFDIRNERLVIVYG